MKTFDFCYTDEFGNFGIESVEAETENQAWEKFDAESRLFFVIAVAQGPVKWLFES